MNCANCQLSINKVSLDIVNNFIEKKINSPELNRSLITLLEVNLQRHILSFITNMDGHRVIHTRKSRSQPIHMEYDSDDEISGYYWNETKNICSKCFESGIHKSLNQQQRLPYLRCDISYFFSKECRENINTKQNEYIESEYFLPNTYIIDYYRQKLPERKENFYFIKCK